VGTHPTRYALAARVVQCFVCTHSSRLHLSSMVVSVNGFFEVHKNGEQRSIAAVVLLLLSAN
jgi:hypothetical protein